MISDFELIKKEILDETKIYEEEWNNIKENFNLKSEFAKSMTAGRLNELKHLELYILSIEDMNNDIINRG